MENARSKQWVEEVRAYPESFARSVDLQHELVCIDPLRAAAFFVENVQEIFQVDGCTVELVNGNDGLLVQGATGIAALLLGKRTPVSGYGSEFRQFSSWQGLSGVPKEIQERCHAIGARGVVVAPIRLCEGTFGLLTVFCQNAEHAGHSLPARIRLLVDTAGPVLVRLSELLEERQQKRRMQDALRESERLAMIGRESAAIAHELKNPLEAMGNLLYLLEHASELNDTIRKYVQEAEKCLKQLRDISSQTLGFSRASINPVPVKISDVLEDVLRFYSRKIAYKNVEIEKLFEFDCEISSYPGELRQLFSNLVVNAIEAVDQSRGRITIHTSRSRLWSTGRKGVRVSIADNGGGIQPANRPRIFQPFFTTKNGKGNGLGLWVCHEIVRRHGGSIQLHSRIAPGRSGTLFSVVLPEVPPKVLVAA